MLHPHGHHHHYTRITAVQQQLGSTVYTYLPRNRFAVVSVKNRVGSTRLGREVDSARQTPTGPVPPIPADLCLQFWRGAFPEQSYDSFRLFCKTTDKPNGRDKLVGTVFVSTHYNVWYIAGYRVKNCWSNFTLVRRRH